MITFYYNFGYYNFDLQTTEIVMTEIVIKKLLQFRWVITISVATLVNDLTNTNLYNRKVKKSNATFLTFIDDWNYQEKIVAAVQGMHVSPAKHSYAWLPIKCDYWTDRLTDRRRTKWSPCAAMLRKATQKLWMPLRKWSISLTQWDCMQNHCDRCNESVTLMKCLGFHNLTPGSVGKSLWLNYKLKCPTRWVSTTAYGVNCYQYLVMEHRFPFKMNALDLLVLTNITEICENREYFRIFFSKTIMSFIIFWILGVTIREYNFKVSCLYCYVFLLIVFSRLQ